MASLKDLRVRIKSVRNTRKITSAMKMVAASKLKRAQDQAEAARPYAERMERMLASLAAGVAGIPGGPKLLAGTGEDKVHLVVVMTSDRGLCGAFNSSVVRGARVFIRSLLEQGKTVNIFTVGRKGRDQLKGEFGRLIVKSVDGIGKPRLTFQNGVTIASEITRMLEAGEFDVCTLIYNRFKSAISQVLTTQQLVPLALPAAAATGTGPQATYEFEPDDAAILDEILPLNLAVQTYRALLESFAGEQGARMAAMDNATRNAGDMINRLTLNYNRTRQAVITKEMIEIVSGAEAI
ncbi:MAG TPA: F0F1 ATP synthase subunit gamma [Alphaproteobacteria bacterium]|jgi:F-type H+-transporting ATPase subunit gamma|nr:F0F1 ATP synthase subunit gamma [Alphaproteobacteria bacterium]